MEDNRVTKKNSSFIAKCALLCALLALFLRAGHFFPPVEAVVGTVLLNASEMVVGSSAATGLFDVNGKKTGKALSLFNETGDQAPLVASVAGVQKLTLANDGKLGIGTTTPSQAIDIAGDTNASGTVTLNDAYYLPVGSVLFYGGSSPASGWLACDGSAVSRSTYSSLFSVISTTFGAGDGSTTFNVPNLKQKQMIGTGAYTGAQWWGLHLSATYCPNGSVANSQVCGYGYTYNQVCTGSNTTIGTGESVVVSLNVAPTDCNSANIFTNGGTYYYIRDSATRGYLATTEANAFAGTRVTEYAGNSTDSPNYITPPTYTLNSTDSLFTNRVFNAADNAIIKNPLALTCMIKY